MVTSSIHRTKRTILLLLLQIVAIHSFSIDTSAAFTLFDRFRPVCPADVDSIRQFDPNLAKDSHENSVWVAVYRSSNNQPSVLIRDEFAHAMRSATGAFNSNGNLEDGKLTTPFQAKAPVAVARLRLVEDDTWVMDSMRCVLKKENMDDSCDGGSEHCEAISVAIDTLLHHHLSSSSSFFQGAIRIKATLISGGLLEERGFSPVTTLEKDMASHVSSLDACLQKYAERSISNDVAKSPGARQRALGIVSILGRLDRARDLQHDADTNDDDDEGPVDPWAGYVYKY
jgi:hypothetical protein